ncbi:hypothetical protein VM1G_05344 [Cytospora mali]|uniref:Uncharacterized protein n=1 Tax=Cytospora mali TaxID=578113 RepID=A0A194VZ35_CYTMA|nr:hypothetical protein VM1G_05344 [Valsa mali]
MSTTIMAWEGFKREWLQLFPNLVWKAGLEQNIISIRGLKHQLDALIKELEHDRVNLSSRLELENNGTAKFVKLLTLVTILNILLDIGELVLRRIDEMIQGLDWSRSKNFRDRLTYLELVGLGLASRVEISN